MSVPWLLLQVPPSDTWFTVSPHWGWYIVVYFFLGGIAGGAAFLSGLLDLFGNPLDRPMTRIGYVLALVAVAVGGPLLIIDLTRPERFWHMVIQSNTMTPMFKWYSPLSFGIYILIAFSLCVGLSALAALADWRVLPRAFSRLGEGGFGKLLALGCVLTGTALAGYTGLVLTTTNRPLWGDTAWMSLLFLLSGISAGSAAMILFGRRRGHPGTVHWLEEMERYSSIGEIIVLAIMAATLWSIVQVVWGGVWGIILIVGVVLLGILAPLLLYRRPRTLGMATVPIAALLVLLGVFLLRTVVILSSEAI
ncbi:MAG: NrfD/PsrC family molybdoenzyme membrane anchor subunit [Thermomicrobiales bacterium]